MKYFSTFSGVEGFGLGIEEALPDAVCIGFSEVDKYASSVLEFIYPSIRNYGDITKIDWATVPDFDLLVGGSPCQDLSIAGKRKGLAGGRSGLFHHYVRALKEKQPQYFIWENVKGALSSSDGWDFAEVQNSFSEAGYAISWQILNAKYFGVAQNRERVFIVGVRGERAREIFFDQSHAGENPVIPTLTARYWGGQANGAYIREFTEKDGRIHQLNNPTHSNDRVYGTGGVAPTLNTMQGGMRQPFILVPEATKQGYAIAYEGDSINLSVMGSATRRGRVGKGIAQTLDTACNQYTLVGSRVRRLTETECERLMSWNDNRTKYGKNDKGETVEISASQRYKMCGNGVVSKVVQLLAENLFK